MKQQLFTLIALVFCQQVNSQNTGIGLQQPAKEKLEIQAAGIIGEAPIDSIRFINYTGLAILAVKALQEQQATILSLQKINRRLEARIDAIEAMMPGPPEPILYSSTKQ